jgi:alkylation response protein AidB-like acyl-CoA dehydrogenase
MTEEYDDIAAMLRESAEDFLARQSRPARTTIGNPRMIDRTTWRSLAQLGWLGIAMPEALGGAGQGVRVVGELCEVFGENAFAEPFVEAAVAPSLLLSHATQDESAADLRAVLAAGDRILSVAWQERADQIDPSSKPLTLLSEGRVSGRKVFTPAVEEDGVLLVLARGEQGSVIVGIDAQASGVCIERHATAGGHTSMVTFDQAPPACHIARGESAHVALRSALDGARIAASAFLSGLAVAALRRTVDYVSQRRQFGRPIGAFQSIQHRCADLYIAVELAQASWRHAATLHDRAPGDGANAAAISAAKARASDVALAVARAAVQMHGAIGFTDDCDIGVYVRAAMQYAAWLGGAAAHRRRFLAHRARELIHD